MGRDLRFGVRLLTKAPGFTAVALATLALGIGAATSIFSVVDAVVFKPLPFRDPDRVLVLWEKNPSLNKFRLNVAVTNFREWQQQARTLEGITGVFDTRVNLTGGPNGRIDPEELKVERTWGPLFPMLGVQPDASEPPRFLPEKGSKPGHANVAILSHSLWAQEFAAHGYRYCREENSAARSDLYRPSRVLPAGFTSCWTPISILYVPLAINANDPRFAGSRMLMVVARLKRGATLDQARNEMDQIGARLEQSNPALNRGWRPNVFPIEDELLFGNVRQAMLVLLAAVGLLLLTACSNVANLSLAAGFSSNRRNRHPHCARCGPGAARDAITFRKLVVGPGWRRAGLGAGARIYGAGCPAGPCGYSSARRRSHQWPGVSLCAGGFDSDGVPAIRRQLPRYRGRADR